MKKLVIFDLDGTLAESKSSLDTEMVALFSALLKVTKVAIISGGGWPQFEKQALANLTETGLFANLSLLPTCGTKFYRFENGWTQLYSDEFTPEEKGRILAALEQSLALPEFKADQVWGERIEDRGSQITLSALGQEAPTEAKKAWDPDIAKRKRIQALLYSLIPEFSVRIGGSTSIDITKPGIDKAYGIRKLREILGIELSEMIFVGDAIFPGGNDYPAKEAGVASIQVRDPDETKRIIETILACLVRIVVASLENLTPTLSLYARKLAGEGGRAFIGSETSEP